MRKQYVFLDIDGVLLHPFGYRKATEETIQYYLNCYGIHGQTVKEDELSLFEALGITSEWDMVPLYLVAYIETVFSLFIPSKPFTSKNDIQKYFLGLKFEKDLDIRPKIYDFAEFSTDGVPPSEAVLKNLLKLNRNDKFWYVKSLSPFILDKLLSATRDVRRSRTTQYFQNLILGSALYEEITGLAPAFECESYLLQYDQSALSKKTHKKLISLQHTGKIGFSCLTARPSLAPWVMEDASDFFPEAELAMKCVGIEQFTSVGFGHMITAARKFGGEAEQFLKPSAFHPFLALLAMQGIPMDKSFEIARGILKRTETGSVDPQINKILQENFPHKLVFHIFEDSPIGIQAVKKLADTMNTIGFSVSVSMYGIANNLEKKSALKKEGAAIYGDINAALAELFDSGC